MIKRAILKWLTKQQMKEYKNKIASIEAVKIKPEDQMYLELVIAVAQCAGVEPDQLAKQVLKKERFGWFMNRMTQTQLEETRKMMESIGEDDMVREVDEISEMLKKEESKHDSKAKSKNK